MHTPSSQPMWVCRNQQVLRQPIPLLMGIVNATPDSFSDGGAFLQAEAAIEHAWRLADQGAAILDIGGESTRPGSAPIDEAEELRRVTPVVRKVCERPGLVVSIDTTKARVAAATLEAGASIINDISGLKFDPEMANVAKEFGAGVVINHIQGTPQTMQVNPSYNDVVGEVLEFFQRRIDELVSSGLRLESICIDPGIGFGKTAAHNLALLRAVPRLRTLGRPVLIGHSRKRFLKQLTGREVNEREYGTLGVSLAVAALGAEIIRVHDVAAHRDSLLAFAAVAMSIDPS